MLRIGTAGWSIPRDHAASAPGEGSHLERYARVFPCCEINSSFHRAHRTATWRRWAESVPPDFRFSVKLPKTITHIAKLAIAPEALDPFFAEMDALGDRLGPLLVQLPPSLRFENCRAGEFLEMLRDRHQGYVAIEPRHESWFLPEVNDLLELHRISRVIADPHHHATGDLSWPSVFAGFGGLAYSVCTDRHGPTTPLTNNPISTCLHNGLENFRRRPRYGSSSTTQRSVAHFRTAWSCKA